MAETGPTTNDTDTAGSGAQHERQFTCLSFGYGSNLSSTTMKQRCPGSLYAGLARLDDYRWQINVTGYANIVPSPGDVVYGGLYFLSGFDEAALDRSEGVPWMYEKHWLDVTRIGADGQDIGGGGGGGSQKVKAMAYVDVQRQEDGRIDRNYVIWVNKAIRDAEKDGMPAAYAEKYLRPFAPPPSQEERDIIMVRTMMRPGAGSLLDQEDGKPQLPAMGRGWIKPGDIGLE